MQFVIASGRLWPNGTPSEVTVEANEFMNTLGNEYSATNPTLKQAILSESGNYQGRESEDDVDCGLIRLDPARPYASRLVSRKKEKTGYNME